jgi:hypothetical protein
VVKVPHPCQPFLEKMAGVFFFCGKDFFYRLLVLVGLLEVSSKLGIFLATKETTVFLVINSFPANFTGSNYVH